jgi:hypothetical protein
MFIDIKNAFINRPMNTLDLGSLQRIIEAYNTAVSTLENKPQVYRPSREWISVFNDHYQQTINNLEKRDLLLVMKMYENFFRHECSAGLHGLHFNMVNVYMNEMQNPSEDEVRQYLNSVKLAAELFLLTCPGISPSVLCSPSVGNPYGYEIVTEKERFFIRSGAEYHYCYANRIRMLLEKVQSKTVFELGGGFGGMAYFLIREIENLRYIAVDLPENIALQSFYLMSLFPEKSYLLYDDPDYAQRMSTHDFDIALLPSFCIEDVPDDSVALSYNSYSLAEMSWDAVNNYLLQINRITSEYFYHVNHTVWAVNADEFSVDSNRFELMFRFPTMWGRDPRAPVEIDHHDYVFKRRLSDRGDFRIL